MQYRLFKEENKELHNEMILLNKEQDNLKGKINKIKDYYTRKEHRHR